MASPLENHKKRPIAVPSPTKEKKKPCVALTLKDDGKDYVGVLLDALISDAGANSSPNSDIKDLLSSLQDLTKLVEQKVASSSADSARHVPNQVRHRNSDGPSFHDVLVELRSKWDWDLRLRPVDKYMESPDCHLPPHFIYRAQVFGDRYSSKGIADIAAPELAFLPDLESGFELAILEGTDTKGDSTSVGEQIANNGSRHCLYTTSRLYLAILSLASKAEEVLPSQRVGLAIFSGTKIKAMHNKGYRLWRLSDIDAYRRTRTRLNVPQIEGSGFDNFVSFNKLPTEALVNFLPWENIKKAALFPDEYFPLPSATPSTPVNYFVRLSEYAERVAGLVRLLVGGMHRDYDQKLLITAIAEEFCNHEKFRYSLVSDSGAVCDYDVPCVEEAIEDAIGRTPAKFKGPRSELLKRRLNIDQDNTGKTG